LQFAVAAGVGPDMVVDDSLAVGDGNSYTLSVATLGRRPAVAKRQVQH
jgi:hypothetical protein